MIRIVTIACLLSCSTLSAEDSRDMILAASRSGVVEFINPSTLETVGRIHFNLGPRSSGLNGVSASADGSIIYVEGPIPTEPSGCCFLYSFDLASLQMTVAASVPGSRSRESFVDSDGVFYLAASVIPNGLPREMSADRLHISPDGGWLLGVKSFRGPALDILDLAHGQMVRQLTTEGLADTSRLTGTWSGDRFYLYAATDNGTGRLWTVSPDTPQLDAGAEIAPFDRLSGCAETASKGITASAGSIFIYEEFGFKVDRRTTCTSLVSGGAWVVDPTSGKLIRHIAPELHFSTLLFSQAGSELYGLSAESLSWELPAKLVRLDPVNGRILRFRYLDPGFWSMAVARLRTVPSGDVRLTSSDGNK